MSGPDKLGRFDVERRLGSGGFATVWLAHDPLIDTHVAIKVLADNWSQDLEIRRRFLDEARLLWNAESERIVRVHHVDELEDGRPYFAMSFADRGTLRDRMVDDGLPFSPRAALSIGAEIGRALHDVHKLGSLHRDIKPGNVLLQSVTSTRAPNVPGLRADERLLLADFGLVRDMNKSAMTMVAGTPAYVAPEQARGGLPIDARADIFSTGVIVYEMLTGRLPFERSTMVDAAFTNEETDYYPPSSFIVDLPRRVDEVVAAALHPNPDARIATAAELAAELDGALSGSDRTHPLSPQAGQIALEPDSSAGVSSRTGPPDASGGAGSSGSGSQRALMLVGLAAVLAIGIILAIVLAGGGDDPEIADPTSEPNPTEVAEAPAGDDGPEDPTGDDGSDDPPPEPTVEPTTAPVVAATTVDTSCPTATAIETRPFLSTDELPRIGGRFFDVPAPEGTRPDELGGLADIIDAGDRTYVLLLVAKPVDEVTDFYRSATSDWTISGDGPAFEAAKPGFFGCIEVDIAAESTGSRVSKIEINVTRIDE